ncbi:alanine--tRNA ligase-related protein, partial [Mucilaginibacter sp. 5B2]|nr:alanine--tRNA ligase-related protein [Mucilaginibacter sp. 5B2]
ELYSQKDFVQKVILEEEVAFLRTLSAGIRRFNELTSVFASITSVEYPEGTIKDIPTGRKIKGEHAFELSDTYGFPIDLTELMAREQGFAVDMEGFEQALQTQKLRSRAATAVSAGDWVVLRGGDSTEFVGYDELYTQAEILKYRKVTTQGKEQYQIVLNRTPFYAEGGGQVGDTGNLMSEWYDETKGNLNFEVTDTKKENGLIIHYANLSPYYNMETGEQKVWELPNPMPTRFQAAINMGNRIMTNANHSATHLLHAALKETLGEHVNQKGSLVNPDQLRFDFSHFSKVTDDDIEVLERIVNQKVREAIPLKEERSVRYDDAIASGVTALFGEKYGDYVRVITFDDKFSKELCGGTHVQNTAEIGFFKITGESAVAAGVRRIEAITSYHSQDYIQNQARQIKALKDLLKNPNDLSKSIESLIEDNNRMKKELEKAVLMKASGLKDQLAITAEEINGINFIAQRVELPNADAVKTLAYHLKDIVPNLFLVLAADINGKPSITVMIDETLVKDKGLHAGNIVKELAKEVKGGGGGQPFFATAGGSDLSGIDNALAKAKSFVS